MVACSGAGFDLKHSHLARALARFLPMLTPGSSLSLYQKPLISEKHEAIKSMRNSITQLLQSLEDEVGSKFDSNIIFKLWVRYKMECGGMAILTTLGSS